MATQALRLGDDAEALKPGSRVFAVSNALGLGVGITSGIVAGVRDQSGQSLIQHSAPVSPGSEGGALLDEQGRLVGVLLYQQRDGQNVNFAVPARWLARIGEEDAAGKAIDQMLTRGAELEGSGQWRELAEQARHWRDLYPDETEPLRWLAIAARKAGNADEEERLWRQLLKQEPASLAGGAGLIQVLLRRGDAKAARELAGSLVALHQDVPEMWALQGGAELADGQLDQAQATFDKVISLAPWWDVGHRGLTELAEIRGDVAGALAGWQKLASLRRDDPTIRYSLIRAYLRAGQPGRAYVLLETSPAGLASEPGFLYLKGQTLSALGRPAEAIQNHRASLDKKGGDAAWVHAALGDAYTTLGRFPEGIAAYREAVRQLPEQDEFRYKLAIALKDGGHREEALVLARQYTEKHPDGPLGWRQQGFINGTLGRFADGIQALERSLTIEPGQGKVWAALIQCYQAEGRREDATRAYEKLRAVDRKWAEQAYRDSILPYEVR